MQIARLQKVPLRQLWAHEAYSFTIWLSQNLDLLGETLGLNLTLVERETAVGPFAADILAAAGPDHDVVIENQLEPTDHDHLGKLITYVSNLGAKTAVWITSDPRPEHEQAIHWLNEVSPADTAFYLLKLEAYQIADSPAAPLLTIVAGANLETKEIGKKKKVIAERHLHRLEFWKQLLALACSRTTLHAHISPGEDNWLSATSGVKGISYIYVIRMEDARLEMAIDRGDAAENKRIFDILYARREQIEQRFGEPLDWERSDSSRASFIRYRLIGTGLRDQEQWPLLQEKMVEAMIRFHQTLQPEIKQL